MAQERGPLSQRSVPQVISSPTIEHSMQRSVTFDHNVISPRRSQSSLRPDRYEVTPPVPARPNSVGRLRDYHKPLPTDDPDAVTKAILDLRADREHSKRKARKLKPAVPPIVQSNSNSSSQENHTGDRRLQQAEKKIDGLMQELDDLKFFEELDQADPSPSNKKSSSNKRSKRHPPVAKSASHGASPPMSPVQQYPIPRSSTSSPRHITPPPSKLPSTLRTPRGDMIPAVIRAASPTAPRSGRLPPPPVRLSKTDEDETLELSPRKIAKMDRTSLELETQTLIRKVQVLAKEKSSLKRQVKGFEETMDQEEAKRVHHLQQVEQSMSGEYQKLQASQRQLKEQWYKQRQDLVRQVELAHQQAESAERKTMSERLHFQNQAMAERQSLQSRVNVLEKSLQDKTSECARVLDDCKRQQDEAESLKRKLVETERLIVSSKTDEGLVDELMGEKERLSAKYEKDKSRWRDDKRLMLDQIKDFSEEIEQTKLDHEAEIDRLRRQWKASEDENNKEMQQSLLDYKAKLQSKEDELDNASKRHSAALKEKDEQRIVLLEEKRTAWEKEWMDLHKIELTSVEDELTRTRSQLEKLSVEKTEQLEAETDVKQTLESLQREAVERDEAHRKESTRWKQKCTKLECKVSELEVRVEDLVKENAEFDRDHLQALEVKTEHLQKQLKESESASAEAAVTARATELALRNELSSIESDKQETVLKLEEKVAVLSNEMKNKKKIIAELECDSTTVSGKNSALEDRLRDKTMRVTELEEALKTKAALHVEMDETKVTLSSVQQSLEEKANSLKTLQVELKEERENSQQKRVRLSNQLAETQAQMSQLESENSRLREQVQNEKHSVDLANERAGHRVEEVETRLSEMATALEKAQSELSTERSKAYDVASRLEETSTRLETLRRTHERAKSEMSNETFRRDTEDSQLRTELTISQGKLRSVEALLEQKANKVESLEKRIRSLDQIACSAKDLETEIAKLQGELRKSQDTLIHERAVAARTNEELLKLQDDAFQLQQKADRLEEVEVCLEETKNQLAAAEDEKISQVVHLARMQRDCESVLDKLSDFEEKKVDMSDESIDLKDIVASDLNDKLSSTIRELQDKLSEERKAKECLIDRVGDIEADLELKEHQLTRLPKLQGQLKDMIKGREELQAQLGRVEAELERKERQLSKTTKRFSETVDDLKKKCDGYKATKQELQEEIRVLNGNMKGNADKTRRLPLLESQLENEKETQALLQSKLTSAESENARLKMKLGDIETDFPAEMQVKVEQLTKEKAQLQTNLRALEEENEEREAQVKLSSERYSNQIVDLQMKVEELTIARDTIKSKLAFVEKDLEAKDNIIKTTSSQHSGDLTDLHSRFNQQIEDKNMLQAQVDALENRLEEKESEQSFMMDTRTVELKAKLESEAKEKRSLNLKIGDVEAELTRKEKQIKSVVDRFTKQVSELEEQLAEQARMKDIVQEDLDALRNDSETSSQKSNLQDHISSLETTIEIERAITKDTEKAKIRVQDKVDSLEKSKKELETKYEKCNKERSEVINALEEVINEVQSREEEIESIAKQLKKREQELEHAKMIATKALASAQEIKLRYKERETGRHSDLRKRISELNKMLDFVTDKNEELQSRTSKLERELQAKQKECKSLKESMHNRKSTKSSKFGSSRSNNGFKVLDKMDKTAFQPLEEEAFPDPQFGFEDEVEQADTLSTASSGELLQGSSSWNEFDAGESIGSVSAESSTAHRSDPYSESRRSLERDALRKYVRKRYLKSKSSTMSTSSD